jgi:hypothetical protein
MARPKNPNTVNASAKNRRRGDETAAARLRRHGWLPVPPEVLEQMNPELRDLLVGLAGKPD